MTDEKIRESATTTTKSNKQHINIFNRGDLLYWNCEYEKAKNHYQMILISPPISLLDSARCYSSLGAVNTELTNYEEAINNYHNQLDLLIKLKIPNKTEGDIAKCLISIGMVYFLQQNYAQAISYQKQALDTLAIVTPAHDLTSKIYRNIANLYAKTKEFDSALEYFQKALALNDRDLKDDGLTLGQIYADIGVMYYSKEDYKQALDYFTKAHATWLKSLRPSHLYVKSMENTIRTVESKLYPDPPKPLDCGGLPCARCNKCTDWKFTGDKATWDWIKKANQKHWPKKDIERWVNDSIYELFKNHGHCALLPLPRHRHSLPLLRSRRVQQKSRFYFLVDPYRPLRYDYDYHFFDDLFFDDDGRRRYCYLYDFDHICLCG